MAASAPQLNPDLISKPLALYLPPQDSEPVIVVCMKEQHTLPVTFTSHPVEQGTPVTDHARPEPAQVTLECLASKTPIAQGYTDANDLWEQLNGLQAQPALINAVTIGGYYVNMGVESVTRPIDVKTANAVSFTITLKAIRTVRNKLTRVVKTAVPKGQPNKKAGAVQTTPLADADNRSAAAKLADGIAGKRFAP